MPSRRSTASTPTTSPSSSARPLDDRLAEAVQGALSDVWNLEKASPSAEDSGARNPAEAESATDGDEDTLRPRTLEELYADMDALGLTVDDMTEVLHQAQRGE